MAVLESAIPEHLRQERTQTTKAPPKWKPAFPGYCARFPESTKDLVVAVIGAQYASRSEDDGSGIEKIAAFLKEGKSLPGFSEMVSVIDNRGFYNVAVLAYWLSNDAYVEWAASSKFEDWWTGIKPEEQSHGWFLEVFFPSIDRFETVFSSNEIPAGAAHMREKVSGPIVEHVYWGSLRDRFPIAQVDPLVGEKVDIKNSKSDSKATLKQRIRVSGKENLSVIRSGQEWVDCLPDERKLYLETMHPILTKGMHFLRDNGKETGCYSCRFMDVIDPVTKEANQDRTFGLAFFDDISSLEAWSKDHPTHIDIFRSYLQYAKKLNNNMSLRLYHEALVLKPEQQFFEYIGCHDGSGMLVSSDW